MSTNSAKSNGPKSISRRAFCQGASGLISLFAVNPVTAKESGKESNSKGKLFLTGGGNWQDDRCEARFVELVGGEKSHIAVLTHAATYDISRAPDQEADRFGSFGVKKVTIVTPSQKAFPKDVDAVYIAGGYDTRLMRLLDKELRDLLISYFNNGGFIGATSAGAMVLGTKMILGGMNDGVLRPNSLRISDGLNILPKTIIDTHVKERQRFDRLMVAVAMFDGISGIGLDEDTAVFIENGKAQVYGKGHARLYRRGPDFASDMKSVNQFGTASVSNVVVSCLASGQSFQV